MAAKCWLWPNKIINKATSGKLRDEHNAAVNEHDIMKAMLRRCHHALCFTPNFKASAMGDNSYKLASDINKLLKEVGP